MYNGAGFGDHLTTRSSDPQIHSYLFPQSDTFAPNTTAHPTTPDIDWDALCQQAYDENLFGRIFSEGSLSWDLFAGEGIFDENNAISLRDNVPTESDLQALDINSSSAPGTIHEPPQDIPLEQLLPPPLFNQSPRYRNDGFLMETPIPSQSRTAQDPSIFCPHPLNPPPRKDTPTSSLVQRTVKHHPYRCKPEPDLLSAAFLPGSRHPDAYLRGCLNRVLEAAFYQNGDREPTMSSIESSTILGTLNRRRCRDNVSIYRIFVNEKGTNCLMCGKKSTSMTRLIGCVRKHLDHRPFICRGHDDDCETCPAGEESARFFTKALLDDHIKGQTKKYTCSHPNCNASLRRGGLRRHWNSMHKGEPYPEDAIDTK